LPLCQSGHPQGVPLLERALGKQVPRYLLHLDVVGHLQAGGSPGAIDQQRFFLSQLYRNSIKMALAKKVSRNIEKMMLARNPMPVVVSQITEVFDLADGTN